METETLKMRSIACQESLLALVASAESPNQPGIIDLREIENHQERFDQWTGNLGAFHNPESRLSLEYRLRNNPIIRDAILRHLADLCDSIRSALDIVSGKRQNRTASPLIISATDLAEFDVSSGSESSRLSFSDKNVTVVSSSSEIEELASAIRGSINSLFKTSVFIRKFAPKERRKRAAEKTDRFVSQTDEMYIKDRYPAVERKGRGDLIVRLGLANAHRRQYFTYCREHSDRLSGTDSAKDRKEADNPRLGQEAKQEVVTTAEHTQRSFLATTQATSLPVLADNEVSREFPKSLEAEPSPSLVSYATTIDISVGDDTAFPPLPSDAHNNSFFLCPYCLKIVELKSKNREMHWRYGIMAQTFNWEKWLMFSRKHVLSDLEPYVCTYTGCSLETYQSQRAWFDHELLIHRGTWPCLRCDEVDDTAEVLQNHIKTHHSDQISPEQLPMVVEQSRRQIRFIHPDECPFCDEEWASGETTDPGVLVVTLDEFRRHVGQHLQRIALFSLPRLEHNQDAGSKAATIGTADRSLFSADIDQEFTLDLDQRLRHALRACEGDEGYHFMPGDDLDKIISHDTIKSYLLSVDQARFSDNLQEITSYICGIRDASGCFHTAKGVFAALVLANRADAVTLLRDERIHDEDLPLVQTRKIGATFKLKRKDSGESILGCFSGWEDKDIQLFDKHQWEMNPPFFAQDRNSRPLHYELSDRSCLPWTYYGEKTHSSTNSELRRVDIHPAQHRLQPKVSMVLTCPGESRS